jgi:hypothetical protein
MGYVHIAYLGFPLQGNAPKTLPIHPRAKALGFLGTNFYNKMYQKLWPEF